MREPGSRSSSLRTVVAESGGEASSASHAAAVWSASTIEAIALGEAAPRGRPELGPAGRLAERGLFAELERARRVEPAELALALDLGREGLEAAAKLAVIGRLFVTEVRLGPARRLEDRGEPLELDPEVHRRVAGDHPNPRRGDRERVPRPRAPRGDRAIGSGLSCHERAILTQRSSRADLDEHAPVRRLRASTTEAPVKRRTTSALVVACELSGPVRYEPPPPSASTTIS